MAYVTKDPSWEAWICGNAPELKFPVASITHDPQVTTNAAPRASTRTARRLDRLHAFEMLRD